MTPSFTGDGSIAAKPPATSLSSLTSCVILDMLASVQPSINGHRSTAIEPSTSSLQDPS